MREALRRGVVGPARLQRRVVRPGVLLVVLHGDALAVRRDEQAAWRGVSISDYTLPQEGRGDTSNTDLARVDAERLALFELHDERVDAIADVRDLPELGER